MKAEQGEVVTQLHSLNGIFLLLSDKEHNVIHSQLLNYENKEGKCCMGSHSSNLTIK